MVSSGKLFATNRTPARRGSAPSIGVDTMSPCIIKDVIRWSQAEGTVLLIPLVLGPAFRVLAASITQRLRHWRPNPSGCRHLDEIVARIAGETVYLGRAVIHEGEVLDIVAAQHDKSGRRGS
jgi:hypothetical protein